MNMLMQRGLIELESFDDPIAIPHRTDLELTVPLSGDVTHKFTKLAHVIQPGHTFTVTLKRMDATPNAKAFIAGYCSTVAGQTHSGGNPKLKVLSITTNGVSNPNPSLSQKYPDGTTEITFELHLEHKEMILIGIILEVFRPGTHGTKQYLCDPQVGNGPP